MKIKIVTTHRIIFYHDVNPLMNFHLKDVEFNPQVVSNITAILYYPTQNYT